MKKIDRRIFLAGAIAAPLAYGLHEVLTGSEPAQSPGIVDASPPDHSGALNPGAPPPPLPAGALEPQYGDPCPPCGMACVPVRSREFLDQLTPRGKPPQGR